MDRFVHLSVRTAHSLLTGAMRPRDLAMRAAELGQAAVAVTDVAEIPVVETHEASKAAGIRPIYGTTLWTWPDISCPPSAEGAPGGHPVVLLAQDETGYRNLCRLITVARGHAYGHPRIDAATLRAHRDGVIALSGPPLGWAELDDDVATWHMQVLVEAMGRDQVYVEVTDYQGGDEVRLTARARAMAAQLGLPCVATNDCRYLDRRGAVTLATLYATSDGSLSASHRPGDQQFVKSRAEMEELFGSEELDRTLEVADRCRYQLTTDTFHFPRTDPPADLDGDRAAQWRWLQDAFPRAHHAAAHPIDPPRTSRDGWSVVETFFAAYARAGLDARLSSIEASRHPTYRERLEFEIGVIREMGFSGYMCVVAEFINWAKSEGIPVGPGRGSVGGCLVAWSMGITDLDSIRFDLVFERFLNPGRVSMPDIDVDFSQARREEVITHVRDRYGHDCVAQIATLMAFKPRLALKDAARAISVGFDEANAWTRMIPDVGSLSEAATDERVTRRLADPVFSRAWGLATCIEGLVRQSGTHAAGVVIGDRPLVDYAPMQVEADTTTMLADMHAVETLGLVKFDFLGLTTLDILRQAADTVLETTGHPVDLQAIPLDDPPTFALLARGDTTGTFQLESKGMQDLVRRVAPDHIEHVIALVALYRPGPLQSGLVDQFVECRHGRSQISYLWPTLRPILEPTYGAIVYQEQVLQIARDLAGYTLSEADLMRRAIGKKKADEMARQREKFVAGCVRVSQMPPELAEELFDIIDKFSGYSFNRAHSAGYGILAYWTAWFRAHHPREFMASVLSWEGQEVKRSAYVQEVRRMGIRVLPPDVNLSSRGFTISKDAIRYGLGAVKGLGTRGLAAILAARAAGGPFSSPLDFGARTRANKTILESLAYSGAFDAMNVARPDVLALARPPKKKRARKTTQVELPGLVPAAPARPESAPAPAPTIPFTWSRRMDLEMRALGTWLTGHPLDRFGTLPQQVRSSTLTEVAQASPRSSVTLVGVVGKVHALRTGNGDRMAFLTLSDEAGWTEVVVFPSAWARVSPWVGAGVAVLVRGRVDRPDEESCSVIVDDIEDLDEVRTRRTRAITIRLDLSAIHADTLPRVESALRTWPGNARVTVRAFDPEIGVAVASLPTRYSVIPCPELFDALEQATGDPRAVISV